MKQAKEERKLSKQEKLEDDVDKARAKGAVNLMTVPELRALCNWKKRSE